MIRFQNVTFKFPYDDFALLEDATFTLQDGLNTILCDVLSGKTTICRLILGEILPQSGEITIDGKRFSPKEHPDVLYLPQNPTFFNGRSVLFNLQYPAKVRKILPQTQQRILQLATAFGFEKKLRQKVKNLSQQEKTQLALARGLTVQRKIVLFDDFFDDTCAEPRQLLQQRFPFCKMAVVLTSCPELACGNTVVLHGKKCVYQGDAEGAKQVVRSLCWLKEKLN